MEKVVLPFAIKESAPQQGLQVYFKYSANSSNFGWKASAGRRLLLQHLRQAIATIPVGPIRPGGPHRPGGRRSGLHLNGAQRPTSWPTRGQLSYCPAAGSAQEEEGAEWLPCNANVEQWETFLR